MDLYLVVKDTERERDDYSPLHGIFHVLSPPLPTDGQMLIKVRTLAGMTSSKNSVAGQKIFCNLGVHLKASRVTVPVKAKGPCIGKQILKH